MYCFVCSNDIKVDFAIRESNLTAAPGFTLNSCTSIGMRNIHAAIHTGTETNPPLLITRSGFVRYKTTMLVHQEPNNRIQSCGYCKNLLRAIVPNGNCICRETYEQEPNNF